MPSTDASGPLVRPSPRVTFQQIGDETVLLDLDTEQYYSLDGIGARVWQWIVEGLAPHEIESRLIDGYDATPETIRADLASLLRQLEGAGLIRSNDGRP